MNNPAAARTPTRTLALHAGRDAFVSHAWATAFMRLSEADQEAPLDPEDLLLLAQSAHLTGRDTEAADLLARAHQVYLNQENVELAARCAIRLGFVLLIRGETAQGSGWLSRGGRLLEDVPESVEHGYLLLSSGYRTFHGGDPTTARAIFAQAAAIGQRFGDKDLLALSLQGQGRSLIRLGEVGQGVALLDEAMVAVTAGEVSPIHAGGVYCSVLEGCGEIFDLRRAQEWTSALEKWCASQPELVPFRGHCLIRRAELLQFHGAWAESLEWAQRAVDWLSKPGPRPGLALALYQVGEVHRLRGNFDAAEEAYREAGQLMRCPGPGLAQLRLVQGRAEAAAAGIRRLLDEVQEAAPRSRLLDAAVEIYLAANDKPGARAAADELSGIAARTDVPFLRALFLRCHGAVLLAEKDARAALTELQRAFELWCELGTPYEAARVRLLIAQASHELGDEEDAAHEITAARETFRKLGAAADLARAGALVSVDSRHAATPLTEREIEVLRLVASGATNRAIAGRLHISEKTVARHMSNIFTKLDLSSRTAAAAYAYDHHLV